MMDVLDLRFAAAYAWGRVPHNVLGTAAEADIKFAAGLGIEAEWGEAPPEGGPMQKIYSTSFNNGFYDWKGIGEVTVPTLSTPTWSQGSPAGNKNRPEYDAKDATLGQPEVLTAPYAANFFWVHSSGDGAIVFEVPVEPGAEVEADVQCMGVGTGGMTIGISTEPIAEGGQAEDYLETLDVDWGEWWSSDVPHWEERKWEPVVSQPVVATHERVWVILRGTARDALPFFGAHFDDLNVWADADAPPLPPDDDLALTLKRSAATLREEAATIDAAAEVVSGGGVPRPPVEEARDLLNQALGET
jgi:hypothetical protein